MTGSEVLESITNAICAFDRDFRCTYANARAAELLGIARDQLLGKRLWDLFPDCVGTEIHRGCERVMAERIALHIDACIPATGKWYENFLSPTKEGLSISWREITERKRREKDLQRTQAYLSEAQRLTRTGSWGWTIVTGEVYWSEQQFRLFGWDPDGASPDMEGCLALIHPEDRAFISAKLANIVTDIRDYEWDCRIVARNGTVKHVHTTAHPILESGVLVEYVGTTMDLSERIRAEAALRRTRDSLARVTRVMIMGELMASVAHELNQPLAAMVAHGNAGMRWLAREPADVTEARRAFERIVHDGTRAGEALRRIRTLVMGTEAVRAPVDIGSVASEALLLLQDEARASHVEIRPFIEPDLPHVQGDAVQLQQAICNLAMNGIEAMGRIEDRPRVLHVEVKRAGHDAILVAVRDSGPGFDTDHIATLFEPFYTTKTAGLGMGLPISRTIVEAHGGRLWATTGSEGTTFRFTLPVDGGAGS